LEDARCVNERICNAVFSTSKPAAVSGKDEEETISNLETIFKVEAIPSDTQMREIIDGASIEPLRLLLPEVFERMRRTGWTVRFVTEVSAENYYTVALDGSEYFHSQKIECPGCLR
jgi:hypothetical protein